MQETQLCKLSELLRERRQEDREDPRRRSDPTTFFNLEPSDLDEIGKEPEGENVEHAATEKVNEPTVLLMPRGVAKTDAQGKNRFAPEKVQNNGNPPFGVSRFFAHMGSERSPLGQDLSRIAAPQSPLLWLHHYLPMPGISGGNSTETAGNARKEPEKRRQKR